MNKKDCQINVRVEPKMLETVQAKARLEYRSIGEIVRGLLISWLKKKA